MIDIDLSHRSPNFNDRPAAKPISLLLLHYTGMQSKEVALERLCDPAAEVSAHYLIDEEGRVYGLVDEDKRAWHAGVSYWGGERDINAISIGIEIVNPGHEFGYRPFTEAQFQALAPLAREILLRHGIPRHRVVGHSDVAPARKQDPGELFFWDRLAWQGMGVWPVWDFKARRRATMLGSGMTGPEVAKLKSQRLLFRRDNPRFHPLPQVSVVVLPVWDQFNRLSRR